MGSHEPRRIGPAGHVSERARTAEARGTLVPLAGTATRPPLAGSAAQRLQLVTLRGSDTLLLAVLGLVAVALVVLMPMTFLQDSWLALVAGRVLWHSGLPHHEVLTTYSAGSVWIDQQWVAQLAMYGLWRLGGLGLVGVVHVALVASGVTGAVVAARRLGASAESVIRLLPLCLWAVIFGSQVRTQAYAYPLFVATVYLLAADSRSPSRRVYLCLPLLILWANLHGSAILGAGLVGLRGLTFAYEHRQVLAREVRSWGRPLLLTVGGPLCLMVTPYGPAVVSYYHDTLMNGSLREFTTEWQPVTSVPFLAAPFFILVAIALWSFGRHAGRTTLWERCALLALAVGGVTALRNVEWFALAGLMLVAVSIDGATRERGRRRRMRPRVNAALAATALLALAIVVLGTLGHPARSFERPYPRGVLDAVRSATAADPSMKVLADVKFADWLLWHEPPLGGRIAYDARFELLTPRRMHELMRLDKAVGLTWKRGARGYRLLVLDSKHFPESARAFKREPGRRILYDDGDTSVILRSANQAAA
jgi:hypothetical protein